MARDQNQNADWLWTDFKQYRDNRKDQEDEWQIAYEMFKRIYSAKSWKKGEAENWRSDTYISKGRQKTQALYSIISDMVFQGGNLPFMLKPAEDMGAVMGAMPDPAATAIDSTIKNMESRIKAQNNDAKVEVDFRRIIASLLKYGRAWGKKSITQIVQKGYDRQAPNPGDTVLNFQRLPDNFRVWTPTQKTFNVPDMAWVSTWAMFWDMEDNDIQQGEAIWEEQLMSPFWLRQRKGRPMYNPAAIDRLLANLPKGKLNSDTSTSTPPTDRQDSLPPKLRNLQYRMKNCSVRERWGRIPADTAKEIEEMMRADMMQCGCCDAEGKWQVPIIRGLRSTWHPRDSDPGRDVECVVMLGSTNSGSTNEIIRYARVEPGIRPYETITMEEDIDELSGSGVMSNCAQAEKSYVGVVRAIEDNARLSANVVMARKPRYIINVKDTTSVTPGMVLDVDDSCPDARMAFSGIEIPNVANQLYPVLQLLDVIIDEESNVPKTLQGQDVKAGNTAYEISQVVEKAGKYVGGILKQIDILVEGYIQYCYEYQMNDPECMVKGNFQVQALGFSSFQDRVTRIANLMKLMQIGLVSPELTREMKLRWFLEEITKALDLDPAQALKSDQEKQEEAVRDQQTQQAALQQQIQLKKAMDQESLDPIKVADAETKRKQVDGTLAIKSGELKLKQAQLIHDIKRLKIDELRALDAKIQAAMNPTQPPIRVDQPKPTQPARQELPGTPVL
jgi:hypothetical protein